MSHVLNDNEMKNVVGGWGATCSAKCKNGSVSLTCDGECSANDGLGVSCKDGSKVTTVWCDKYYY